MSAERSRMRGRDLMMTARLGLRSRPARALLTIAGVAVGIASMVAVTGITSVSRAELLSILDEHGTNLLEVRAGGSLLTAPDEEAALVDEAVAMIRRIGPVEQASATRVVDDATVRRNDLISASETRGINVVAAETSLLDTLGVGMREGRWLEEASPRHPVMVLGTTAAQRLGFDDLAGQPRAYVSGEWFQIIGIVEDSPLAPDLATAAMIGYPVASEMLDLDDGPGTVRVRAPPESLEAVRDVLPATANPESPGEVEVSRPSDSLEARAEVDAALTTLLLGLGGVALLVGGIGIANVMVISVLERRREIGVRRALGATRAHIRRQFLAEACLLAGVGGAVGTALGVVVTVGYALVEGLPVTFPVVMVLPALGLAVLIGGLAGLYPAVRAGRMAPAEAIRA